MPADAPRTADPVAATRATPQAGRGLAGVLVLAIAIALALAAGACAAILLAGGHTESTEQAGYLASALAGAAGAGLALWLDRRSGDAVDALAGLNAIVVGACLVADWRLMSSGASTATGAAVVLAGVAALLALDAVWLLRAPLRDAFAARRAPWIVPAAVGALAVALLPFAPAPVRDLSKLGPAGLGAVALCAALVLWRRRTPPAAALVVDLAVCALLALLVIDLRYHPDAAAGNDVLHHLNFYLGPVNDVLHGRAMLVDTFSQYGVGVIYAIAAAYEVTGSQLSYGSFELGVGVLTALWFIAAYALLRVSMSSQLLAVGAVALAVLTHVFDSYSFASYPMSGALRFAPPFLVLLALVVGDRRGARTWPALALAGLISIWSIETFAYALGAVLAYLACSAWLRDDGVRARIRRFATGVGQLAAATLVAQALFALATRLLAGAWPDWGRYLDFLALYGSGNFGKLLIAPFSSGLALGGVLVASTAAVVVLCVRGIGLAATTRARLPLIAGLTGLGIVVYTYYLGRSAEGVQPKIGVPVVLLSAIWIDIAIESARAGARAARLVFAVLACTVGLTLAISARPAFDLSWPGTALAAFTHHAVPVSPSDPRALLGRTFAPGLRGRVQALLASPIASAFDEETAAQQLVSRYAGAPAVAVLLGPEMTTEVLVRSRRINALPIATPTEDALLADALPRLSAAAARLPAGTVLITDRSALDGLTGEPDPALQEVIREGQADYLRLRQRLLATIRTRFRLRRLASDPSGVVAVSLTPR